jgi:drug/metabolite transporter (DMT)-like permease
MRRKSETLTSKLEQGQLLSVAAILAAVVIWGFSFLSIKVTVAVIGPMTLTFLRFILASVVLYWVKRWLKPTERVARSDWWLMIITGIIGITLYYFFENHGVKLITASAASIIIATIPILTLLTESLFFKAKLTFFKVFGVILSLIGVYLVVGGDGVGNAHTGLGYLLMSGAGAIWVLYVIVTRPLFAKYSNLTIVTYQSYFATLSLIPFVLMEETRWLAVTPIIIANLIFMGVFCSAMAYYFYVYALEHLGANKSALFLNFIPVVSVICAWFILKEQLSWVQMIGGLLIMLAVSVAEWQWPRVAKRKTESQMISES